MRNVPALLDNRAASCQDNGNERRTRERLKVCLPVHIRPLRSSQQQTGEAAITMDFNRNGLCFATSRNHYHVGMSLFLTFPYSPSTSVRKEYAGEVVRVELLPNGHRAVAVKFLSYPNEH
jgi:hypothetical protein